MRESKTVLDCGFHDPLMRIPSAMPEAVVRFETWGGSFFTQPCVYPHSNFLKCPSRCSLAQTNLFAIFTVSSVSAIDLCQRISRQLFRRYRFMVLHLYLETHINLKQSKHRNRLHEIRQRQKKTTNNKLSAHMASKPGVEPGPHWWEESTITLRQP